MQRGNTKRLCIFFYGLCPNLPYSWFTKNKAG